ncbi:MAG: trypsin-like peptidase domain-containing protein [Alphaproteobacteria bacterium]|nr:trypsin-like peptidase domain-containing protein [Alphaproteobacteria bacterium]
MLIRTNALRSLVEAEVRATPVTEHWGDISSVLTQRCGADVAALFAEPSISRSNGASESIARWYSEAEGPAVSFSALDATSRGAAAGQLTSLLSRLEPVLRDPETADLVGPIVQIPSMADVMVVGGRPVIVNWGFLPDEIAATPQKREAHFRTTLGQFLPGVGVPSFVPSRSSAVPAATTAAAMVPAAAAMTPATAAAAPVAAVPAATPVVVAAESRYRPWLPISIATGVALLALLVLLIPGVLVYPEQGASTAEEVELRKQMNRALEEHVEKLRKQLAESVCTLQNPVGPGGTTPGGPPRSTPGTPGQQGAVTPPGTPGTPGKTDPATPPGKDPATPGQQGAVTPPGDGKRPLTNAELLAGLEKSTVLVLTVSADGNDVEGFGTGFFINDKQIVTNRHVIQNAQPGRVVVVNKTLARPALAKVIASSPNAQPGREDFALLEIEKPSGVAGVSLAGNTERLSPVTAAGYTGTLVKADPAFLRLIKGEDLTAMPEMVVTQGIVTVIQQNSAGPTLVYHTATISGGNSGGPLVDACGRVVAINTFNAIDKDRPISFNGAQASANLVKFLETGRAKRRRRRRPRQPRHLRQRRRQVPRPLRHPRQGGRRPLRRRERPRHRQPPVLERSSSCNSLTRRETLSCKAGALLPRRSMG